MDNSNNIAFISYHREADHNNAVTLFRENLENEVSLRVDSSISIFQDIEDIGWGENWWDIVKDSLDQVMVLIPIVTPSLFKSKNCRKEIEAFLNREESLKNETYLILPVIFVELKDSSDSDSQDELVNMLSRRHKLDWTNERFKNENDPSYIKAISTAADRFVEMLEKSQQISERIKKAEIAETEVVNDEIELPTTAPVEPEDQDTKPDPEKSETEKEPQKSRLWFYLLIALVITGSYYYYCQTINCSRVCIFCKQPEPVLPEPEIDEQVPKGEVVVIELKAKLANGARIIKDQSQSFRSTDTNAQVVENFSLGQEIKDVWRTEDDDWLYYKTRRGTEAYFLKDIVEILSSD